MSKSKKKIKGVVVSICGNKTIKVQIKDRRKHKVYAKIINFTKNVMVHDETCQAKVGSKVEVVTCRPISRKKKWLLSSVVGETK